MSTATISNSASVTWEFNHSAAASYEQLGVAAWEKFEKSRLPELQALYRSGRYADLADAILDSFVLDEPPQRPRAVWNGVRSGCPFTQRQSYMRTHRRP